MSTTPGSTTATFSVHPPAPGPAVHHLTQEQMYAAVRRLGDETLLCCSVFVHGTYAVGYHPETWDCQTGGCPGHLVARVYDESGTTSDDRGTDSLFVEG